MEDVDLDQLKNKVSQALWTALRHTPKAQSVKLSNGYDVSYILEGSEGDRVYKLNGPNVFIVLRPSDTDETKWKLAGLILGII